MLPKIIDRHRTGQPHLISADRHTSHTRCKKNPCKDPCQDPK